MMLPAKRCRTGQGSNPVDVCMAQQFTAVYWVLGTERNGVGAHPQNTLICRGDRRLYLRMQQSQVTFQYLGQSAAEASQFTGMGASQCCVGSGTSLARAGWHPQMQQPILDCTQPQKPFEHAIWYKIVKD